MAEGDGFHHHNLRFTQQPLERGYAALASVSLDFDDYTIKERGRTRGKNDQQRNILHSS